MDKLFLNKNRLLPLLIVIVSIIAAYQILLSGDIQPKAHLSERVKNIRIVEAIELTKTLVEPVWHTTGDVIPSEAVELFAKVSGNVDEINELAIPGKKLTRGDWLVKLDPTDFQLAVASQQAQLAQAEASLSLEQADQILAKEELSLINNNIELAIEESLVLRKPQLVVAQSKVRVAENNVEKAKLNLSRAIVTMPFDGQITDKKIGRGSKVSQSTALFSIVNTETFWIEIKIPQRFTPLLAQDKLAIITQPRSWGEEQTRHAQFVSILSELDSKDRQAKVLLAIHDPLSAIATEKPAVFINDFVNVELKGKHIEDAWTIKHSWLQKDNTIWVVDSEDTLQKRPVEVLFKGRDYIYVRASFAKGDLALSEKPGIASVGLPVKAKVKQRIHQSETAYLKQSQASAKPSEIIDAQELTHAL
ncbi:MAG: efflux RND transporter periplasmic adaptor subunit [Colwellia sp.]|nr:efflux RND transporter periplasmic adaptor subunit [Colwellia sp.]MCW8866350.1 efflux RND transporter periplasmic adaptor subunit [Colwellia sp.]MCW9080288.1 efflux RND transporter periplasmic adaptor subunit [Colwellia sp.]